MIQNDEFSANLMELDHLLVRQFRTLQELVEITQKERAQILEGSDSVIRQVEEKEALLDQLGLIEDSRRQVVEVILVALGVKSASSSVNALLPYLAADDAARIGRLAEGIVSLASQARGLNHENHALALVRLNWIKAAQAALIGVSQPDLDYRPPVSGPPLRETAGWGAASLEIRA